MMGRRLNFEIGTELETSLVTPHAGIASLVEAYRSNATAAMVERAVEIKTRQRGLPAAQTARDFLSQFHADDLPLLQAGKASMPSDGAGCGL
jgi:hypothetical protein